MATISLWRKNYSAAVWPRSTLPPPTVAEATGSQGKEVHYTSGLSQPASGQFHLAWRMILSVRCLISPVRMPPLAWAYLPIDRCDVLGPGPRNDNWFNWWWWMKGFYGAWIISWWQSGGWWRKFIGQKAKWSCCGFISHSRSSSFGSCWISFEMLLPSIIFSAMHLESF